MNLLSHPSYSNLKTVPTIRVEESQHFIATSAQPVTPKDSE